MNTEQQAATQQGDGNKPVVLITGCSGLIGSRIAEALGDDYQLVGLDIQSPQEPKDFAAFEECDLTDDDSVKSVLAKTAENFGNRFASVIHLAAYYDFSGEPSPLYDELTVKGTQRLLRELRGYQVEQFLFSSSLLVMKPVPEGDHLREDSPTQAEWEYPESKLATEQVIRNEHGPIPVVVARIAGVYDEYCHSVPIGQQIRRIYEKDFESYFYPGNADHGQSFVHISDVVRFFEQAISYRDNLDDYEAFLVGEADLVTYGELQEIIGELIHGKAWPTIRLPKVVAKAGAYVQDKLSGEEGGPFIKPWMIDLADAHYPVDNSKARAKLDWEPLHTLRGTLKPMIGHLLEDPAKWYEQNNFKVPKSVAEKS